MSKPAEPKMLADLKREHSSAPSAAASDSSDSLPTLSRTSTGELMSTTVTLSKPDSDDASSTAAGEAAPGSGVGGGDHTQRISTTIEHEAPAKIKVDQEKGQLHLFSKKRAPKVKRLVTFRPQLSSFDRFNPSTSVDLFRGFYTLFWIFLAIMVLRTGIRSWKQERTIIGLSFARLIGGDGIVLALSDLALVASTVLCVPFMQLVEKGYIPYHWTGLLLQHIGQALFLASAITWTFFREWYWVQSGFLTLHSITMIMKVHSYLTFNGNASIKREYYHKACKDLDQLVDRMDGKEHCLKVARAEAQKQVEGAHSPKKSAVTSEVPAEPASEDKKDEDDKSEEKKPKHLGVPESVAESDGSDIRRRRSRHVSLEEAEKAAANKAATSASPSSPVSDADIHVLCFSPVPSIADAANAAADLADEITAHPRSPTVNSTDQSSPKDADRLRYPHNLTYRNFIDYLILPTLVYELDYPRTNEIRPLYVLEKTLATFGTFSLLYIITEHYILPITNSRQDYMFWELALELTTPFMINYVLIFYIIFECICNGFAELSMFADRGFYDDWWNSTSFDEFARKWNKPVHQFLLRHVYASSISAYSLSKFQASFATFLLSACLHELVMAVVSKKFRMYLFLMQMAQLPLILMGRASIFKKYPGLGNIFFWIGLMSGFPMLAVGYLCM